MSDSLCPFARTATRPSAAPSFAQKASCFRRPIRPFNSEQSIQAYALVSDVVTNLYLMGIGERNIANLYSDFHNPPTDAELYTLIPPVPAKQDVEAVNEIAAPINRNK
jgi:hypothetical protein